MLTACAAVIATSPDRTDTRSEPDVPGATMAPATATPEKQARPTTPESVDDWMAQVAAQTRTPLEDLWQVENGGARIVPEWEEAEIKPRVRRGAGTELTLSDREVSVYDCSEPVDPKAIVPRGMEDCKAPVKEVEVVNKTYVLLQRAQFEKLKVRSCRQVYSRLAFYCGAEDHQTFIRLISFINKPKEYDVHACWDL